MLTTLLGSGRRESRASVTSLGHPASSDGTGWGWQIQSSSGESVTELTALELASVWACCRVIADTIASTPLPMFKMGKGHRRDPANTHPVHRLLNLRPNPEVTVVDAMQMQVFIAALWGVSYRFIERDAMGRPINLWNMPAASCTEERQAPTPEYPMGRLMVRVLSTHTGESPRVPAGLYSPDNFLALKGITLEGARAVATLALASEVFGSAIAAEKYQTLMYRNGAMPGLVLSHPARMQERDIETFRRHLVDRFTGPNRFRPMILQEGMTATPIPTTSKDAQSLESRKHSQLEIARWFGVPPHKIQIEGSTPYATREQAELDFIGNLRIWATKIQAEYAGKLLTPREQTMYGMEFAMDWMRYVDAKNRAETHAIKIGAGTLTRDEARAEDGRNPLPGGVGEIVTVQMQDVPLASQVDGSTDPDPAGGPDDVPDTNDPGSVDERAVRRVFEPLVAKVLREAAKRWSRKAAERLGRGDTEASAKSWLGDWAERRNERKLIEEKLEDLLASACKMTGLPTGPAKQEAERSASVFTRSMIASVQSHAQWESSSDDAASVALDRIFRDKEPDDGNN